MRCSIASYLDAQANLRLDPEFYDSELVSFERRVKQVSYKYLGDIVESIISFGAYALCNQINYVNDGIPFIRCKDIIDGEIRFSDVKFIDEQSNQTLWKSEVFPETLLITMSGTVGNCVVAPRHIDYPINSNQDIAKVVTNKEINVYYLMAYLCSRYGQSFFRRFPIGSIQQHVFIWQLNKIPIFIPSNAFQQGICDLMKKSESLLEESKQVVKIAEHHLLTSLNLIHWQPQKSLSFIAKYSKTVEAQRIDADYFQPYYYDLLAHISKQQTSLCSFKEAITLRDKNYQPEENKKYHYIELSNIGNSGQITGLTEALGQDLPSRARRIVREGDVIISSIQGSLESVALISDREDGALCSTGFHVAHSDIYNSETLMTIMKSIIGQMQLRKGCNGTILTAISKDELNKIKLPKIPDATQLEIKRLVQQMYEKQEKSKKLIDVAKRAVEIAIDEDEDAAVRFIDQETA
jgi:restriction endonuclease S subunit